MRHGYVDVTVDGVGVESIPMAGSLSNGYEMADGAYAAWEMFGDSYALTVYEGAVLDCANKARTGEVINGTRFDMQFRLVDEEIFAG